jgi:chemotaxis protein MotA
MQWLDPGAMSIVLGGTVLATVTRCGWRDLWCGAQAMARALRGDFDADANRVAAARAVTAFAREGALCAEIALPPDPTLGRMIEAYRRNGSIDAANAVGRAEHAKREAVRMRAVRLFECAGELAPVFGLVGTLFSIVQLMPATAGTANASLAVIASAALSTIYGVLLAHLVCLPLAQRIERAGEREEAAREELAQWLIHALHPETTPATPPATPPAPARLRGVA